MLVKIKSFTKQKGQGIVEYAILLSVIIVLAMMPQSSGIKGEVTGVFDSVSMLLRGETEQDRWARMSTEALLADSGSSDARLEADQEALRNIGRQFLGMTRSEVEAVLNTNQTNNVLLGNFTEGTDSNGNLVTNFAPRNNKTLTGNIHNWAEGNGSGAAYDSSRRYLYSDYAVKSAAEIANTGSGVKAMNIKYDSNNRVSSIDIAVNPNSGGKAAGLWVTVK